MELNTAISLIEKGVSGSGIESWADLGAGDGLFTRALSTLLYEGSVINAVDKKSGALRALSLPVNEISLNKMVADFEDLEFDHLDGVLMANSLHFIKDQLKFLKRIKRILLPSGQLIVIEYDSDKGSLWVPYPLSFVTLKRLVISAGFKGATKLTAVPSRFGRTDIYSAAIEL